ncbi:AMP-binding protein [Azospirillum aestuarii]|nr:AMP-binding protein [Azospirillum aestuarii]
MTHMASPFTVTPIDQLRHAAATAPGARIRWNGHSLSYGDLLDRSLRCASALRGLGVGPGDRVAFWLPNGIPYLDLFFACLHIGAIAVSVNTRFRRAEVESIVSRTGASAIVVWPGFKNIPFLTMLGELDPAAMASLRLAVLCEDDGRSGFPLPGVRVVHHRDLLAETAGESAAAPELPCIIFPTSGTTGLPKFALHRQGAVAHHAAQVATAFGYDAPDAHLLQAIPFCGVFGFSQFAATLAGAASVTLMSLFEPVEARDLIRSRSITHLNGPDDLFKRLLDVCPEDKPFPSLRDCLIASFNPTLALFPEEAERRGVPMTNGFGMSEIFSFFSRQAPNAPIGLRKLSGGHPVNPKARVRVRDTATGHVLPPGGIGSLEIASDTLFCAYFGNPEATRDAFTEDGFFITGDLATMRVDGGFIFKGRSGDVLRLGGFLVDPAEIEAVLQRDGSVETAVVVEAATERGNKPVAFLRLREGAVLDEAALRERVGAALADFKIPARFVVVDQFPTAMSPNGEKIQRGKLKERAQLTFSAGG